MQESLELKFELQLVAMVRKTDESAEKYGGIRDDGCVYLYH